MGSQLFINFSAALQSKCSLRAFLPSTTEVILVLATTRYQAPKSENLEIYPTLLQLRH